MSQRRIRERGGGGLLIREKAHRRGGVYLKGKLPREGDLYKRRLIREGVSSGRGYIEERSLSERSSSEGGLLDRV